MSSDSEMWRGVDLRVLERIRGSDELYGAGCWTNWLRFDSPLRTGEGGFLYDVSWKTDAYRGHRNGFPEWYPLNAWPEPGGILPVASSIDGDNLCWLTEGGAKTPSPTRSPQGSPLTPPRGRRHPDRAISRKSNITGH